MRRVCLPPPFLRYAFLAMCGFLLLPSKVDAGALQPDAGSLQQQLNPGLSTQEPKARSPFELPATPVTELPDSPPITIRQIEISGNQAIDTGTLHELVRDFEGGTFTLKQLQQASKRITEYYRAQGYLLSRAVLPPQQIEDGRLQLQVIEARYGQIQIENSSRIRPALINATMASLQTGQNIAQSRLDRALLMLSDIPGGQISLNLRPGKQLGETDVLLEVLPTPAITAKLTFDDYGNVFTNRLRTLASVNILNPLHAGDVLSLSYLTTGNRLQYGRASYEWLLNGIGTRLGVGLSHLSYILGDDVSALQANGFGNTLDVWLRQPLLRSRRSNVFFYTQWQHNALRDRLQAVDIQTYRDVNSALFTLFGDMQDEWLGGGVNGLSATYVRGDVSFKDAAAAALDAAGAHTAGNFSKWFLSVNRLQNMSKRMQLWLAYTQQFAQDNLDSSQKMVFGGPYSVRAYDNGTLSADSGALLTMELKYLLADWQGPLQAVLFMDAAQAKVSQQRYLSGQDNRTTLMGAGFGVSWTGPRQVNARLFYAQAFGPTETLVRVGDQRITWFELNKTF